MTVPISIYSLSKMHKDTWDRRLWFHCKTSKKSPTGPEWTPKPEYLITLPTSFGFRWDSVLNFWWKTIISFPFSMGLLTSHSCSCPFTVFVVHSCSFLTFLTWHSGHAEAGPKLENLNDPSWAVTKIHGWSTYPPPLTYPPPEIAGLMFRAY